MNYEDRSQRGLSLIEVLIAMLVTTVGVMAVALLIVYGINLQTVSRHSTRANGLAKQKIEQFQVIDPDSPELAIGGSLATNIANHYDETEGFVRRWEVLNGPANTLEVRVRVEPNDPGIKLAPVEIHLLLEGN